VAAFEENISMSARVVHRMLQADERVKLGAAKVAISPLKAPSADPQSQARDHLLEQRAGEIAQLHAKLAQAQQDREQLSSALARIESELADARQLATQQGYQAGLQQAQVDAERELGKCTAAWQRTVEQTSREVEARLQSIRTELAEVTLACVTKLIGDQLLNPQVIRATIEQTLKEAGIGAPLRILLAPAQYDQLTRAGASHVAVLRERRIEVAPDPRVTYGGCLVEAAGGLLDGRFEVQLAGLKSILAGHYSSAGAAR
jgi:flagellar biosynthesis/type III secretory pathway protein FliH